MTASSAGRRLRSSSVKLALTGLAAATVLTGCAEETPDYQAVCVDPSSEVRVDDGQCSDDDDPDDYDGSGSGFFWFYMATNSHGRLPAVGEHYSPSSGTYRGSSLVSGGKSVVRGGAPAAGASSVKSFTSSTVKSGGFGGRGVSSS